jgi:CopA family copper-resistance protein
MNEHGIRRLKRRTFLRGAALSVGGASLARWLPGWAQSGTMGTGAQAHDHGSSEIAHSAAKVSSNVLTGESVDLTVGATPFRTAGRVGNAVTINGTLPGPLLRLREGQTLRARVHNMLAETTSIHWHGLLLPFQMDGVPGISFPGIAPGEAFTYEFPLRQAGTYWYHSHSNMQEAIGMVGPIIIDPVGAEAAPFDREHVLVLTDWSFLHPHEMLRRLKQDAGYFNHQRQTLMDLARGRGLSPRERLQWARMRMDPTDIADVTGATYTYLINGHDTAANWTGLYQPGERVRLRIINAASMTNFNVRLPGLPMTVVQADGQDVAPVEVDELQIAIAETFDVILAPRDAGPYAFIAESLDRSGLCRATLAVATGAAATVPALRPRPMLTMKDMGMNHGAMDHGSIDHGAMDHAGMDHAAMNHATMPMDRTGDRPTGLEDVPHRVLTYRDLRALQPHSDTRAPTRQLDVHLTGNMERYLWSFDGVRFSERAEPLVFRHGERVRVNLINETMMPHPIHLHGHFFEVVNGQQDRQPRKHTVNVLPGARLSFDLTADALGDWALHCHMLLHMHAGMFRVVTVRHIHEAAS